MSMGFANRKRSVRLMQLQLAMKTPSSGYALVSEEAPGLRQSTETTSQPGISRLPGGFSAYPQNMGVAVC
jgi:hypothetical protein